MIELDNAQGDSQFKEISNSDKLVVLRQHNAFILCFRLMSLQTWSSGV